ncbi:MAG: endopeptidase La [Lachnospira sp.]
MITLPVIALRSMTVLPDMVIHFDISRKKSIQAVETAMEKDQKILVLTQKDSEVSDPGFDDLYRIGTVAVIKQVVKMPNKLIRVQVEGIKKGRVIEIFDSKEMLFANVETVGTFVNEPDEVTGRAIVLGMREMLKQYAASNPRCNRDLIAVWLQENSAKKLMESFVNDFPMEYENRQKILEMNDILDMYEFVAKLLIDETNAYRIKEELSEKVKEKVEQNQKEYILREQMNVLAEELEGDDKSEIDEFTEEINKLNADKEVKEKLLREVRRIKKLSHSSSEANVERMYVETCLSLPWNNMTKDNNDIENARRILDEDHYGMKEVKDRIIESLAVRNITSKSDAPILCLVGPPGTGKTSIAKSVARALEKKYVRICLGGVRDEAEIRGHRKTYIGAMPGRIIEGLRQAESSNPLMLLDEIDKISSDYKGDTSSALLEVLDSEQNSHFIDHYIELPTDLSNVLFIATANDLSSMSKPLLDRMEIIEVSSYTFNEKMHIAKEHLVKKQVEKNGLTMKNIKFSDKALKQIILGYTKEAGVRELERQIAKVCRKAVTQLYELGAFDAEGNIVAGNKSVIRITEKNLSDYLGKIKYRPDKKNNKADVGIVRGLAWTSVGGDTLEIEVNTQAGKGELTLTGQLGDVMKESATIAYSYVKSVTEKGRDKVDGGFYENHGFHIHVPEGAVPKDGPSAGVTMATAIYSAVTGIPVRADLAMTGEITLRGRVLPIGGLKEKLLASKAAGITTIIVPEENRPDVEEFDEEITRDLEIVYVDRMSQVLDTALVRK